MTEAKKATIYIDVDDEITNIIEKVKDTPESIVALVLPKRAAVLQSIVNMKLLKRSSDNAKKKIVLITSEAGLLPLAGAVGVHVAKNLQSKPEIPPAPEVMPGTDEAVLDDEIESGEEPDVDNSKTIGELAGAAVVGSAAGVAAARKKQPATTTQSSAKPAKAKAPKGKGKFSIPNFEKFRSRLFLIILGVIGLFAFLYWAFFVAPSAKITVVTDTETINRSVTFTADPDAETLDTEENVVPAEVAESKDVKSEKVAATGTKDVGEKATGTVNMTARVCGSFSFPESVPAGTGVSANNLTYITQQEVSFPPGSGQISGGCINFTGNASAITAQKSGSNYNTGNASFTVSGRSDVTASGSASGGTTKEVKVVSQGDVDKAAKNLSEKDEEAAKAALKKQLEDAGYLAIDETFKAGKADVSSSPNVGSEASEVTVTATINYSMTGVKKDDLEKLIAESVKTDIDEEKQQVVNTGLDEATYSVEGNQITVDTIVTAGPKIDVPATIDQIAGKKRGEVEAIISATPGVKEVRVDYSPFWVTTTPKKTSKIQIVFEDSPEDQNNEQQ